MNPGEGWLVVVHDDVNLIPVVHYLLRKICGHDWETARDLTMVSQRHRWRRRRRPRP